MFEMISDFVRDFSQVSQQQLTILSVMVGWAVLLIYAGFDSKTFAAIFIPGMFLGGMAAFYVKRVWMLNLSSTRELDIIMVSVLGIIVGFLLTIGLMQLVHWIGDRRRPVTLESRN